MGSIVVCFAQKAAVIDVDSAVDIARASLHQSEVVECGGVATGHLQGAAEELMTGIKVASARLYQAQLGERLCTGGFRLYRLLECFLAVLHAVLAHVEVTQVAPRIRCFGIDSDCVAPEHLFVGPEALVAVVQHAVGQDDGQQEQGGEARAEATCGGTCQAPGAHESVAKARQVGAVLGHGLLEGKDRAGWSQRQCGREQAKGQRRGLLAPAQRDPDQRHEQCSAEPGQRRPWWRDHWILVVDAQGERQEPQLDVLHHHFDFGEQVVQPWA